MTTEAPPVDREQMAREREVLDRALHESFLDAVDLHIRFEAPMVFWEDGKVVEYGPERLALLKTRVLQEYKDKYGVEYTPDSRRFVLL